jgi:sec-independent protein translocase protein TatC
VQASQYYKFAATTLLALGLLFQVPVAILLVTCAGVVTARQLRRNRRYAVAVCGAVAALLPGDPTTMLLETVPLYLLFEISVAVAGFAERRAQSSRRAAAPSAIL